MSKGNTNTNRRSKSPSLTLTFVIRLEEGAVSVFIRYDSHITCCQLVSPFNIQSEFFFFSFEEIYLTSESPGGLCMYYVWTVCVLESLIRQHVLFSCCVQSRKWRQNFPLSVEEAPAVCSTQNTVFLWMMYSLIITRLVSLPLRTFCSRKLPLKSRAPFSKDKLLDLSFYSNFRLHLATEEQQ